MLLTRFKIQNLLKMGIFFSTSLAIELAVAANDSAMGIGEIARNVTASFQGIAQLMIAIAYISGVGFSVASIFKFKQHKDNPTQVPLGTPIALLAIAVSLIYLGYFIKPLGATLGANENQAGGPRGEVQIPGMLNSANWAPLTPARQ